MLIRARSCRKKGRNRNHSYHKNDFHVFEKTSFATVRAVTAVGQPE